MYKVEKEKIEADDLMAKNRFARAIAQYNSVDALIEDFTTEVENKQKARGLYDGFLVRSGELEIVKHLDEMTNEQIMKLNLPTGIPFVYELDKETLKPVVSMQFLGDEETGMHLFFGGEDINSYQ